MQLLKKSKILISIITTTTTTTATVTITVLVLLLLLLLLLFLLLLLRAWSFLSFPSLMNLFLCKKNPAMLLVPLLFSPFLISWNFLKAACRKASSSSAIMLLSIRSSIKRHWNYSLSHKTMNARENFWNVYCFATNQMRDETAKDNR